MTYKMAVMVAALVGSLIGVGGVLLIAVAMSPSVLNASRGEIVTAIVIVGVAICSGLFAVSKAIDEAQS